MLFRFRTFLRWLWVSICLYELNQSYRRVWACKADLSDLKQLQSDRKLVASESDEESLSGGTWDRVGKKFIVDHRVHEKALLTSRLPLRLSRQGLLVV